ncbi:MAG TPA: hypothetical protein VN702_02715 [Acetobacteraceae bacterium]|nr:hypothetical protein [Acetobacteraceae bacterium]
MRIVGMTILLAALAAGWPEAPVSAQPAAAPPANLNPQGGAQTANAAAARGWPHTLRKNDATITVYQPQAVSWPDRKTLTARAALAITTQGHSTPIIGSVEISLATTTDEAAGVVHLSDPKLLATHFPSLDTEQATAMDAKISQALPDMQTHEVPLASVLLSLKQSPVAQVAVNNDPPTIFHASRPASLVVFDGDPVLAPIGKTGLSSAVNTNWDVFVDHGTWYLLNNGLWLSAPAATGPYAPVTHLPAAFNALPKDTSFAEARKNVPARPPKSADQVPTIFVSTKPAGIIVTAGPPKFAPVSGTGLERVTNTASALFFDSAEKRFYVLLSGRWFSAASLDGPWEFATDKLPPDFALIPPASPEAAVLASVPGTVAAQEAVLKAQIPTTATLSRSKAKLTVVYSGLPKFEPIPGTSILHAVNTNAVVLKIGDKFYACESGAWFVASSPNGPWALADSIPPVIKTIPSSSPLYNVTYVQVYSATPTTVTYGYTAGYVMGFVSAGVLVYGTGYYYPPVIVPGPVPIYYPYPYTYASGVYYSTANGGWVHGGTIYGPYGEATGARYYNPTTGAWARGGAVYGPYGGAGAFSAYNPSTGSYAHGSATWGGGSGTANASFYNARTGVSGSTNQNVNPYGRWGSSTISGPNQTVNTQSRSNAQGSAGSFSSSTGAEGAGYHNRATGNSGGAVKTSGGDVYAGRDGNVYQHTDSGWSKWNNGGWSPVQPPSNSGSRTQPTSQRTSGTSNVGGTQYGSHPSSTDRSSYQQLEQDRLGREAGEGRYSGRYGSGGGSGGGRFEGGGRFRR